MRLIDAEDIPYTMLYKENWIKGTGKEAQGAWKSDIDKMPTIDAVPVVRCGDCKWYMAEDEMCGASGECPGPDDYCSYGKRRTDESD